MAEPQIYHQTDPPLFLSLPLEIRRDIYALLLPSSLCVTLWPQHNRWFLRRSIYFRNSISILLLNQQISSEALDVLYRQNSFIMSLNDDPAHIITRIPEHYRRRIRRLTLYFCVGRSTHQHPLPPIQIQEDLWSPLLENLLSVEIVSCDATEECVVHPERPIRPEVEWIVPVIRLVNRSIPAYVTVALDEWSRNIELRLMLADELRNGFRLALTKWGDIHFQRT